MRELEAVLAGLGEAEGRGEPAVLATVVSVKGSAYRRPGAHMLLLPDGRTVGTVSGGCLEGDVKLRAWRLTAGGPAVVRYDSTSDNEVVWELGLGCKGVVHVLLERVEPGRGAAPLDFLRRCVGHNRAGVLARVVAVEGQVRTRVGDGLSVDAGGRVDHDFAEPELAAAVARDAALALRQMKSRYAAYPLGAGRPEVFHEVLQPPLPLLVCGAGHDAIPLVRLAKELGWRVAVTDPRPNYATRERFPLADEVIVAEPEELTQSLPAGGGRWSLRTLPPGSRADASPGRPASAPGGAAVVMSHNYHNDLLFLRALLPSPLRYLGVLGPRSRTEALLGQLAAEGVVPTGPQEGRLYGPVGLDLGGDTPESIALAVVAEVQAVFAGRRGGSLRERDQPIHDRAHEVGPRADVVALAACPAAVA